MKIAEFDYNLPKHLIAQLPSDKRDHSKLMVVSHLSEQIEHRYFYDIIKYLNTSDVLVLNNTKVLPVKLVAQRQTGGLVELLLVCEIKPGIWEILINSRGKIKSQETISFENNITGKVFYENRKWLINFDNENIHNLIPSIGKAPLPPYIKRTKKTDPHDKLDKERYQTVYAVKTGAIAAPTAGMHFTNELLDKIKDKGIIVVYLTLHIGRGTFEPIRCEDITNHRMYKESFEVLPETIATLIKARRNNQRIIAVGTTVCRTLETIAEHIIVSKPFMSPSLIRGDGGIRGWTDLFIHPPYKFKLVTGLITNFHLPRGTPLILTCAFGGKDKVLTAYQKAITHNYRFFSYGDAMLLL